MEVKNEPVNNKSCGEECEVYSRVTGYYRPVARWNKGKREEFKERKPFEVAKGRVK